MNRFLLQSFPQQQHIIKIATIRLLNFGSIILVINLPSYPFMGSRQIALASSDDFPSLMSRIKDKACWELRFVEEETWSEKFGLLERVKALVSVKFANFQGNTRKFVSELGQRRGFFGLLVHFWEFYWDLTKKFANANNYFLYRKVGRRMYVTRLIFHFDI